MFYDKLPYRTNFIINEKYMAWLEKADVIDTLGTRISYTRKWVNNQCLHLHKQKKMKKKFLTCWDTPHQWGKEPDKRRKEKFLRKRALTSKGEKNIKENIFTNEVLKGIDSLEKPPID